MKCSKCSKEYPDKYSACPYCLEEVSRLLKEDYDKYDRIDRKVASGVFDRIDEQRRFVAQLILTLDVVLITFTPPILITGLEKLESSGARPLLYWFGLGGLILAVLSLAAGLLFYGCTSIALLGVPHYLFGIKKKMLEKNQPKVPREKMDKAVERNKIQWRLARTFARLETAFFLAAIIAIVTGVFVLLANVYCV